MKLFTPTFPAQGEPGPAQEQKMDGVLGGRGDLSCRDRQLAAAAVSPCPHLPVAGEQGVGTVEAGLAPFCPGLCHQQKSGGRSKGAGDSGQTQPPGSSSCPRVQSSTRTLAPGDTGDKWAQEGASTRLLLLLIKHERGASMD